MIGLIPGILMMTRLKQKIPEGWPQHWSCLDDLTQIMRSWVLFLFILSLQTIAAFHYSNDLFKPRVWRSCRKLKVVPPKGVAGDGIEFGDKVLVSVKLPTPNRNIVESFLRSTDFLVENVWDKLKITKTSDGTYFLGLASIPVPGFSIISPEAGAKLTHVKDSVYVHFDKWCFKDGCGNILKDAGFVNSLQVALSGKIRISRKSGTEQSENLASSEAKIKCPVGGEPLYLDCSVDYKVTANKPAALVDSTAVENTITLLRNRVHDFMHVRLPLKLVKAFKAYGAKLQQSTEYWL